MTTGLSLFRQILQDLERDRFVEAKRILPVGRNTLELLWEELEKIVRMRGLPVNLYMGYGSLAEAEANLPRIRSLADMGSTCYVLGVPGGNVPTGGGITPVTLRPPDLESDRFVVVQGSEFAAALLAHREGAPGDDRSREEYRAVFTLDRKVVSLVVAELNKLLLARRVPMAPTPKPAASFVADVARAQAGSTLLCNLAGQVDTLDRRLHETAMVDDLTGLYNQRFFYMQLLREGNRFQRYGRPFTIVFQEVIESNPQPQEPPYRASREVLKRLSATLRDRVRGGVDLAFRLHGNEFAVLLVDAGEKEAAGVAVRIENEFVKMGFTGLALKIGVRQFNNETTVKSLIDYAHRRLAEE